MSEESDILFRPYAPILLFVWQIIKNVVPNSSPNAINGFKHERILFLCDILTLSGTKLWTGSSTASAGFTSAMISFSKGELNFTSANCGFFKLTEKIFFKFAPDFLNFVPGSHLYMFHFVLKHAILIMLSNRCPATGGGEHMEIVISFLVAVAAGVTCHLICKWLDSHNKDNE